MSNEIVEGADQSATAKTENSSGSRLLYVDNLRILVTVLVILHHLSIGYGGPGDWYYNEKAQVSMISAILLTLFVALNQSFFMGFFFMVSSFLMPASLDRKGTRSYLVDRLQRLGIPMLIFFMILNPFIVFALQVHRGSVDSLWGFLRNSYASSLGVGPTWFLEALLIFALIYALFRRMTGNASVQLPAGSSSIGNGAIAAFAIALGTITFILRIWLPVGWWLEPLHLQLAHFPQYTALFTVGIVAYRRNWLDGLSDSQGKLWLGIVIVFVVVLFPIILVAGVGAQGDISAVVGGLHWQSLAYSVWEQVVGIGMIVTLLVWFRRRFNRQGALARTMSRDSYAVYVFHAPVVVLLAMALSGISLEGGLKFILVAPAAVALAFFVGHYARRIPIVGSNL